MATPIRIPENARGDCPQNPLGGLALTVDS